MSEKEKRASLRKIIIRSGLAIGLIVGVIWSVSKYLEAQKYETTDDAQVEGEIIPVSSRVSGYVVEIRFIDNQEVLKGDTLVILDNTELKVKVSQAQLALQNSEANLEVAKANSTASEQGVTIYNTKEEEIRVKLGQAEKELIRYKNLLEADAGTQQQYDKAKTMKETLEAEIKVLESQIGEVRKKTSALDKQISVAQSIVEQRKNELELAKIQLSYTYIKAPCNGIVSKKSVQIGQNIQMSQPLFAIVSEKKWVVANFKETQLDQMHETQKVIIEVDAFNGRSIGGSIESFSPATGSKFSLIPPDNASGNYVKVVQRVPVKIKLETSDELYNMIKPGMSVFVKVRLK